RHSKQNTNSTHLTGAFMRPTARALKTAVLLAVTFLLLVHRSNDIRAQSPALTWDGLIEHVTEAPYYNAPSPDGSSYLPRHATSADGHYVVFTSDAENLVGYRAIFRRDRHTGDLQPLFPDWGVSDLAMSANGNH